MLSFAFSSLEFVSIGFLEDMSEESMERSRLFSLSSRTTIAMVGRSPDSVMGNRSEERRVGKEC